MGFRGRRTRAPPRVLREGVEDAALYVRHSATYWLQLRTDDGSGHGRDCRWHDDHGVTMSFFLFASTLLINKQDYSREQIYWTLRLSSSPFDFILRSRDHTSSYGCWVFFSSQTICQWFSFEFISTIFQEETTKKKYNFLLSECKMYLINVVDSLWITDQEIREGTGLLNTQPTQYC